MASNLDDLAEGILLSMLQGGWQNTVEALAASAYDLAKAMLFLREQNAPKPVEVKPPPPIELPFWVHDLFHNGAEWVARKKLGGDRGSVAATGKNEEEALLNLASLMRAEGIPFDPKQ
jgi:hypothetical protein